MSAWWTHLSLLFVKLTLMHWMNARADDWPLRPLEEKSGCSSLDSHSQKDFCFLCGLLVWCVLLDLTGTHASGLHWPAKKRERKRRKEVKVARWSHRGMTECWKHTCLAAFNEITSHGDKKFILQEKRTEESAAAEMSVTAWWVHEWKALKVEKFSSTAQPSNTNTLYH